MEVIARRLLILFLVVVSAVSLVGCGKKPQATSADINDFDSAVRSGNMRDVTVFLDRFDNKVLLNGQDGNRIPPICMATDNEMIKLLVNHGADANVVGPDGQAPLLQTTDKKTIELLISHGADVNAVKGYDTPLRLCINSGNEVSAGVLVSKGADPSLGNTLGAGHFKDDNCLQLAALGGMKYLVKSLIEHGADVNVTDYEGNTPLIYAIMGDKYGDDMQIKIIDLLLENKADINMLDSAGRTPLYILRHFYSSKSRIADYIQQKGGHE